MPATRSGEAKNGHHSLQVVSRTAPKLFESSRECHNMSSGKPPLYFHWNCCDSTAISTESSRLTTLSSFPQPLIAESQSSKTGIVMMSCVITPSTGCAIVSGAGSKPTSSSRFREMPAGLAVLYDPSIDVYVPHSLSEQKPRGLAYIVVESIFNRVLSFGSFRLAQWLGNADLGISAQTIDQGKHFRHIVALPNLISVHESHSDMVMVMEIES